MTFDDCDMVVTYNTDYTPVIELIGDNVEAHCREGMIQLRKSPTGLFVREEPCSFHLSATPIGEGTPFYCGLFNCPLNGESPDTTRTFSPAAFKQAFHLISQQKMQPEKLIMGEEVARFIGEKMVAKGTARKIFGIEEEYNEK